MCAWMRYYQRWHKNENDDDVIAYDINNDK